MDNIIWQNWKKTKLVPLKSVPRVLIDATLICFSPPVIALLSTSLVSLDWCCFNLFSVHKCYLFNKKWLFLYLQLRNLVWATSKHDVYLLLHYSVLHWSALNGVDTEIMDVHGHVAPSEVGKNSSFILSFNQLRPLFNYSWCYPVFWQKHPGSLLEGFLHTQISTMAVKDNLLVAGGFQGELICKVNIHVTCIQIYDCWNLSELMILIIIDVVICKYDAAPRSRRNKLLLQDNIWW